ncbi:hypothetical protein [Streptomyces indiaensis]|uniref:hypothetical protein n=1 Tax=Streptomyces indiaensis TaxID=284033 RepID=UPI001F18D7CA|nr:hypothetical protein [Streptomyces indiaensis]MCF1644599.1 hypothetical protein [Streptomyces indiaensis]
MVSGRDRTTRPDACAQQEQHDHRDDGAIGDHELSDALEKRHDALPSGKVKADGTRHRTAGDEDEDGDRHGQVDVAGACFDNRGGGRRRQQGS